MDRVATKRGPAARVSALETLGILDSPRERDFDEIVEYVARLCDVPTSLISLVDANRQWFKAACGFNATETPLDQAICLYTLEEETFLEIHDTAADARTRNNSLCQGEDPVRFYAGAILRLDDGVPIGTLCVLDRRPRHLNEHQRQTMSLLARQVVRQMQLREALSAQDRLRGEIDHRVKNSLQMVASYLRLQRRSAGEDAGNVIRRAEQQVAAIVALHDALQHRPGPGGMVDLGAYLERIATLVRQALPHNIAIDSLFAAALCSSERAAAAGLILNEFVANSVKHAFPDDCSGRISLRGRFYDESYELTLSDDGVGGSAPGSGFGLSIIDAAARQLGAKVARPDAQRGVVLDVIFRVEPVRKRATQPG